MDRGAWWATVHGVSKSRTRLSDFTFSLRFHALEKEMATHSSVLALRIPGTGKPGWAAVCGVAQSPTRLKRLSSRSSSSRLVMTFLPRSKRLLISWLQSPSAEILEPPKIKSDTVSTVSPSISHEVVGPDARTFVRKVMCLLLNRLCRLVITFLPRSKSLLISWLQSPFVVILEPPQIKSISMFPLFSHLFAMK